MINPQSILPHQPKIENAQPIRPVGSHLFREEYFGRDSTSILPFLSKTDHHEYWDVPDARDKNDAALQAASDFGRRAAAAWFIFNSGAADPEECTLISIAESMAKHPGSKTAQIAFWHYLGRLLHQYGFHVSPSQIANDVEAVIAEDQKYAIEEANRK